MRKLVKGGSFKLFSFFDRFGLHVLPKHYYTPVPDYRWLEKNKQAWMKPAPLTGMHWNLRQQLDWVAEICKPYYHEVAGLELYERIEASTVGAGFGPIESQVLHCFVRAACPPRIIEIGSGVSTDCMLHAASANSDEGRPGSQIICVEPFPKKAFRHIGNLTHIEQLCQTVPDSVFAQLQSGDLLFIDSSHALKVGSDVVRIYLDIIPKLPPGVFIHIHDIYLPYLYSRHVLRNYFGWQETSLLLALLTSNERLSLLSCLSALHYDRPEELAGLLSDYRPQANVEGLAASDSDGGHFPCSLWLRTA